ncbi:ABC transporter ATP-binding protein [Streptomyces profundus]|uniref:ABC transporter ATP-binding protein n=1 Tax=Streptomyces profundus TaxID=2867410 RepID=UPI001D16ACF1|nr:ABC transporter ATP-binding protein [Streptomyces sp. MA3_2.13]
MGLLEVREASVAYEGAPVIDGLDLTIPPGRITALVGPNGCGKSTLLRALARLQRPTAGTVLLDGRSIWRLPPKELARQVGLLAQSPATPTGLLVEDLVARGRYPHQSWLAQWSERDEAAVAGALRDTGAESLRGRYVDELSGGQRQRVWIAMAIAQETDVLLLDEPTTYLDVAYQVEIMELLEELHDRGDRTIVVVLHDLNQACRHAHHLVALRDGQVLAEGAPETVVTEDFVQTVFDLDCRILTDPVTGRPLFVPERRRPGRTVPGDAAGAVEELS